MRKVVAISLPEYMFEIIDREIKSGCYKGRSEFFQLLIRHWQYGICKNDLRRRARSKQMVREIKKTGDVKDS